MGGCWDVMGGRVLRWRWGAGGSSPKARGAPSCQDSSGQVRVKGRRVRFHSGPRRSASLVRVRPRERRRLWIARIWLRFRRRRTPEPCPDPGCVMLMASTKLWWGWISPRHENRPCCTWFPKVSSQKSKLVSESKLQYSWKGTFAQIFAALKTIRK